MKKQTMKFRNHLLTLMLCSWILGTLHTGNAQDIRWLRVGNLQSPINEVGAEYEVEFNPAGSTSNFFSWPAQYSIHQTVTRMKAVWIGCENFDDPVEGKIKSVKVVGSGPKSTAPPDQVFPEEIKLIAKYPHPDVYVDDAPATSEFSIVPMFTRVMLEDFDRYNWIKFKAFIEYPEEVEQIEEVGTHVDKSGFINYALKLENVEGKTSNFSLDDTTAIMADLVEDTSIMMEALLAQFQRRIL